MAKERERKKSSTGEITIKFGNSEIIEREVTRFGTGAHIVVPKEYANKKVKIIFEDDK